MSKRKSRPVEIRREIPPGAEFITVGAACALIGGDRPIHPATYYRLAKRNKVPRPIKLGPKISRIHVGALRAALAIFADAA